MAGVRQAFHKVSAFGTGMWRYWRTCEPAPESQTILQKLEAYTDGKSSDILFRILESKRRGVDLTVWDGPSLVSDAGIGDDSIAQIVHSLHQDGVAVLPSLLKEEAVRSLHELALSCPLKTMTYGPLPAGTHAVQTSVPIIDRSETVGIDLGRPHFSYYAVPREVLLENHFIQCLLCDPYLLAVATRYLGVFPIVTRPDMWWDTEFIPAGLRPRPFHVDSGCLRWLKVGINLTDTTMESPHFIYVKGSHKPDRSIRPLTRRLANRMNLSDKEVTDICPERIVHITAPAGSVMLADTRGIHKGELSERGNRLVLYFGLEGSAFNYHPEDQLMPLRHVGAELQRAMEMRQSSYRFFRMTH